MDVECGSKKSTSSGLRIWIVKKYTMWMRAHTLKLLSLATLGRMFFKQKYGGIPQCDGERNVFNFTIKCNNNCTSIHSKGYNLLFFCTHCSVCLFFLICLPLAHSLISANFLVQLLSIFKANFLNEIQFIKKQLKNS